MEIYFLFPFLLFVWRRFGSVARLLTGMTLGALETGVWFFFDSNRSWGYSCPWFVALFTLGIAAACVARRGKPPTKWRAKISAIVWGSALVLLVLLWQFPVTGKGEYERFLPALPLIDSATGVLSAAMLVVLCDQTRG